MSREAVLLMAYGSPDRLDQVEAYYTDIRRGSPPPPSLLEELLGRYRAIGGGSPLSRIVEEQRAALESELARRGTDLRVYDGMKHIEPRIAEVVRRMAADGVDRFVAIALAPQSSTMSTATYRRAVEDGLAALPAGGRGTVPAAVFVDSWHDEPRFIDALASKTADAIDRSAGEPFVLFTAHSLPARVVASGDPYPTEVAATAALVAARLGATRTGATRLGATRLGLTRYGVAFQSAGRTDEPWLGPELRDELRRLATEGVRDAVVCPVGFVADHLEVLYDIDIEAAAVARDAGIRLVRAETMNTDPTFIAGLADLVTAALHQPTGAVAAGR